MIASMIFFPTRDFSARPEDFGLKGTEVWCQTKDKVKLHGWYLTAEGTDQSLSLLLFHGNADNISIRLPKAHEWVKRGISVFLIDYRGYGKSEGKIEKGNDLIEDAKAALKWLKEEKKLNSNQIVLYGESIGSVPAIALAAEESFAGIILEAPFTSLKEVAKIHYGMVPDFLIQDFLMDNESKISNLKAPVLIVQGTDDEVIPFEMGQRLFKKAPEPKQFLEIKGAHHNDISQVGGKDFFETPYQFILQNLRQA